MKFLILLSLVFLSTISIFAQNETEKGVELYRNGDYDGAISVLENVVKTDEKDRKVWIYLGASYVKKKKDQEAGKAFRTANSIFTLGKPITGLEQVKIISKLRLSSEGVSKEEKTSGRISFAVELKADGKIGFVVPVINSLSVGLTRNAVEAARSIKFEPAQKDGKPITVVKFVVYSFNYF